MTEVYYSTLARCEGVFVCLVVPGSPAAMAGLRFGDQLLTLGKTELAGKSLQTVHCMLRYRYSYKPIKSTISNKPKGLKVAKEDQRSIGLMVDGLDGR